MQKLKYDESKVSNQNNGGESRLKEKIRLLTPRLQLIFNHLHTHPEISWEEAETTKYIAELLKEEGLNPITFDDCTGLYVDIGHGKPVVGLRTDLDALWQEIDGQFKANHSCGHDGHMTMVIGVTLLLNQLKEELNGTVRILFQPAEEKGQGAIRFVEKGIVDDIDYLYGVHVRPIQELEDGTFAPAILHGAAKLITGTIIGEESHGARPHLGKNAIEIGSTFIEGLKQIHTDPMIPASIKLTQFQAGGISTNIIPGKATFSIDARAQTNEVMDVLIKGLQRVKTATEEMYDAKIDLDIKATIAAASLNEVAMKIMKKAIIDSVGEGAYKPAIVTPGGEDFHFYTLLRPHIKATMLGLGCGLTPGLHHPKMTFNTNQLVTGVEILTRAVLKTFEKERSVQRGN